MVNLGLLASLLAGSFLSGLSLFWTWSDVSDSSSLDIAQPFCDATVVTL
jgi:hypothetical protein